MDYDQKPSPYSRRDTSCCRLQLSTRPVRNSSARVSKERGEQRTTSFGGTSPEVFRQKVVRSEMGYMVVGAPLGSGKEEEETRLEVQDMYEFTPGPIKSFFLFRSDSQDASHGPFADMS